jgi:excisionase family DNA binding protein
LITIDELSAYLGVPVKTIYDWRNKHKGPAGYHFGRHPMFAVCDVRAWIEQQRDPAPAAEP